MAEPTGLDNQPTQPVGSVSVPTLMASVSNDSLPRMAGTSSHERLAGYMGRGRRFSNFTGSGPGSVLSGGRSESGRSARVLETHTEMAEEILCTRQATMMNASSDDRSLFNLAPPLADGMGVGGDFTMEIHNSIRELEADTYDATLGGFSVNSPSTPLLAVGSTAGGRHLKHKWGDEVCDSCFNRTAGALIVLAVFLIGGACVAAAIPLSGLVARLRDNINPWLGDVVAVVFVFALLLVAVVLEKCMMRSVFFCTAQTWAWPVYYAFSSLEVAASFLIWATCGLSVRHNLAIISSFPDHINAIIDFIYTRSFLSMLVIAFCHAARVLAVKMWLLFVRRDAFIQRLNDIKFKEGIIRRMSVAVLLGRCSSNGDGRKGMAGETPFTRESASLLRIGPLKFVRYTSSLLQDGLIMYDGTASLVKVGSPGEAAGFAESIFNGFRATETDEISESAFVNAGFFPSEAADAMKLFDPTGSGGVCCKQFCDTVAGFYTERRLFIDTMHDWESSSKVVDRLSSILFWLLMVFVVLLIFELDVSRLVVPIGFSAAAFSMALGSFAKDFFDSLLMVFVVCPFSVGDLVKVNKEEPMYVEAIHVLSTTFRTFDNRLNVVRNHQLAQANISNYRRSTNARVSVNIKINIATPDHILDTLRKRIVEYVASLPEVWLPVTEHDALCAYNEDADPRQLILQVMLDSVIQWKDWEAITRIYRPDLLDFLRKMLLELDIKFNQSMLPVKLMKAD